MKEKRKNLETGQILVILTVGILALLGFTALAVDGGMYLSDRRYDHNAADASAFSGAEAVGHELTRVKSQVNYYTDNYCSNSLVINAMGLGSDAAVNLARYKNHFPDFGYDLSNEHGVEVTCHEDATGKYIDVHTMITSEVKTAFAHLFYSGPFINTVEAVTRVDAPADIGGGNTLVSLDNDPGDGLVFGGNGIINIDGQGHSNSDINCIGKAHIESDGLVYNIEANNTQCPGVGGGMYPPPTETSEKILRYDPDIDWCTGLAKTVPNVNKVTEVTLSPGLYSSIDADKNGLIIKLEPGLYCVEDGIKLNGDAVIMADDAGDDDGITFYVKSGTISINGKVEVSIRSANIDTSGNPPAEPGLLIYSYWNGEDCSDPSNTDTITMNGGATTTYEGTVYAPCSLVKINGNDTNTGDWDTQIIANSITITGDATVNIHYSGDEGYIGDAFAELFK